MRAAAILGLGTSTRDLQAFQKNATTEWTLGLPANSQDADAILIFGGDGTIHRNLNALVRLGLPVLVVPAGSGNDFARALGLLKTRDSLMAWRAFENGSGRVQRIDLGCIVALDSSSQHHFACVAGVGLDADIARRANTLPRWLRRTGGYVWSLPPALFSFHSFQAKIFCADEPPGSESACAPPQASETRQDSLRLRSNRPTFLAAFANAPFYGDGMKIAPNARLDDGLLDVCLIRDVDKFKLFCLFPTVYFGRHLRVDEVDYFRTTHARIETETPLDVYADGEPVCHTPAAFHIAREALQVIVKPE